LIKGNKTNAAEKSLIGVGLVTVRRLPTTAADATSKYQAQLHVDR
jgi:hypothetical protein